VDEWVKSDDKESFSMARKMIREEGLLCGKLYSSSLLLYAKYINDIEGGSCGAAMHAALHKAKSLKKGQRCVVILPDSLRNYMTKYLKDEWMRKYGFLDDEFKQEEERKVLEWGGSTVRNLSLPEAVVVTEHVSIYFQVLCML
jgi:cystathionine beta-synthase